MSRRTRTADADLIESSPPPGGALSNTPSYEDLLARVAELERERAQTQLERAREAAHARNTESELRALMDNASSAVALGNAEGRFTQFNRRFLDLFGLAPDADIKNVNDTDWAAWRVFDESGELLHVDDHPVRKAALTRKPVREQVVGVQLPAGGPW